MKEFLRCDGQTDAEFVEATEWYNGRPAVIQKMVRERPPGGCYLLSTTGQKARIVSYSEDRTVRIVAWLPELGDVWAENETAREVFGVKIDDLEPWKGER